MQSTSSQETKPQLDPNRSLVLIVVDQDKKFCNLFSSIVGRTHQVIEATNGAQALSLALTNPPDAIFLGDSLALSHAEESCGRSASCLACRI